MKHGLGAISWEMGEFGPCSRCGDLCRAAVDFCMVTADLCMPKAALCMAKVDLCTAKVHLCKATAGLRSPSEDLCGAKVDSCIAKTGLCILKAGLCWYPPRCPIFKSVRSVAAFGGKEAGAGSFAWHGQTAGMHQHWRHIDLRIACGYCAFPSTRQNL